MTFFDEVLTVEDSSTLLHLGGDEGLRVEPLTVLERAVGAEFQVDILPAETTIGVSVEAHDLLLLVDITTAIRGRLCFDLGGEDGSAVRRTILTLKDGFRFEGEVERDILRTVGTVEINSVGLGVGRDCGTTRPQAGSQSFHFDSGFELGVTRFVRTVTKRRWDAIRLSRGRRGYRSLEGQPVGVLTGYPPLPQILKIFKIFQKKCFYPPLIEIAKKNQKIRKNKKNMKNTNVCITSRIIFCNFV